MSKFHQTELAGMPPARAPRRGSKAWKLAEWNRFQELARQHGGLTSPFFAQVGLGLSKQRVYELIRQGRLPSYEVMGKLVLPCDGILEFATVQRPSGRPSLAIA